MVSQHKLGAVLIILSIVETASVGLGGRVYAAGPKQFSDYPVAHIYKGKGHQLDASSAPEQWSAVRPIVKDIIHDELAKGPNFAGAYYLATVGCGSDCEAIFVIDLRNGQVFAAPQSATNGIFFQKDSRLIIIKEDKDYDLPRTYLVFKNNKFKALK